MSLSKLSSNPGRTIPTWLKNVDWDVKNQIKQIKLTEKGELLQYTYKYNTAPATIENFGPKNATTEGAAQLEAANTQ